MGAEPSGMVILTDKLVGKARLVGGSEGLLYTASSPCLHSCHLGALLLEGTHIGHSENGVQYPVFGQKRA